MEALSDFDLPTEFVVQPVLCFIDAEWGLLSGNLSVDGVAVVPPRGLKQLVQNTGPLDAETRHELSAHLAQRLPSMT